MLDADLNVGDWVTAVAMQHQRLRRHRESIPAGAKVTVEAVDGWLRQHRIQYRSVRVDLAEPDFLNTLVEATNDLDLGLVTTASGPSTPSVELDDRPG